MGVKSYRILIVDDDHYTQRIVEAALLQAGFGTASAETGEGALRYIKRHGLPHLAIVDLNLKGKIDGYGFCKEIKKFTDLPIIVLSGIQNLQTIIRLIDMYAEDYVTKPFNPRELVARVRRVIYRIGNFACELEQVTRIDEQLSVNFGNKSVTLARESIPLTPAETKLLYILLRHAHTTVATSFLLERLWPLETATEERLRVLVYRLRRKLEPNPDEPYYIVSTHGVGYTFTIPSASPPLLNLPIR